MSRCWVLEVWNVHCNYKVLFVDVQMARRWPHATRLVWSKRRPLCNTMWTTCWSKYWSRFASRLSNRRSLQCRVPMTARRLPQTFLTIASNPASEKAASWTHFCGVFRDISDSSLWCTSRSSPLCKRHLRKLDMQAEFPLPYFMELFGWFSCFKSVYLAARSGQLCGSFELITLIRLYLYLVFLTDSWQHSVRSCGKAC